MDFVVKDAEGEGKVENLGKGKLEALLKGPGLIVGKLSFVYSHTSP